MDDLDENMQFLGAVNRFDNSGSNAWDDCRITTIPDAPEEVAAFDFQETVPWDTVNEFAVGDENVPNEVRSYESDM